jgi:putative ABC transport system permease protein
MTNFDDDTLTSIQNEEGVKQAEARRVFNVRARVPGTNKWTTLDMTAFQDFEENSINLLTPVEGTAIPKKRELVLEKNALDKLDIGVGGQLELQLPDGSTKILPVVGIVQDTAAGAADFLASPFGYITMDTLPSLGQPRLYDRAYVTVTEGSDNIEHIRDMGAQLKDKLERNGNIVIRSRFNESHKHPLADTVNAILGILMALGVLILFLSGSLIANTLNALLNQHLRHIGVIKLVGGQRRQVFIMYFALILAFAILALIIAVPLGGQGAYGLSLFIGEKLKFSILGFRIQPVSLGIQVLVGLLIPLIAGLAPVINGSKITVLRALSGDASEDQEKVSAHGEKRLHWLDWMQVKMTRVLAHRGIHIPRPFVISLRNTFRRKRRLVLTLFTLTMGGAIFIAVFNVRDSLHSYIDGIGDYFVADVSLDFDEPYRINEIQQKAMEVKGVQEIQGWQFLSGDMLDENGDMLESLNLFGPPADSKLVQPNLVEGRWIQPGDVRKLALSEGAKKYYPDLQAGDTINLKINGRDELWQVVGIFKFIDREGVIGYAPYEYISQVNDLANQATSYRVVTDQHDRSYQDAKAISLDQHFRDLGYKVRIAQAGRATLDTATESIDILVVFLLIMAILTAVVGSMGLTGTMGMNVLERTREIGIMRAIGADDRAVMRTVIAEAVVIGMISFVLAIILSIPFTYLLSTIISLAIFQSPIATVFTITGYAIWLALVLVLSALASILPARNAASLTIREVLAYE